MTTVSVVIPSYNHEAFVGECIQSVLDQTYRDFEIIITDDASTDRTVEKIRAFRDPRIKLFTFADNQGACVAANHCIRHASGKYIAMLSSDDAWHPDKLKLQVQYLNRHPSVGAVFSKVEWIDETGATITRKDFRYNRVFDVSNRSRFAWLNHLFSKGNCLCHPSSLIRRACYRAIGLLDPRLAIIPDYDLWIRLCLKYEIYILGRKLVRFRRLPEERNASGDNPTNRIRIRFEHRRVLDNYLKIKTGKELMKIFPAARAYGRRVLDKAVPYVLGRMAIDTGWDFKMLWGLDVIFDLLRDERKAKMIEREYGFTYADFLRLSGTCDPHRITLIGFQPPLVHPNPIRRFLSASKRYAKEVLSIVR